MSGSIFETFSPHFPCFFYETCPGEPLRSSAASEAMSEALMVIDSDSDNEKKKAWGAEHWVFQKDEKRPMEIGDAKKVGS